MSSGCQVDGDGKSGTRMDADKKADCCVLLLVLYARLMREDATAMIETNTLITVSYTHLDVYKRQAQAAADEHAGQLGLDAPRGLEVGQGVGVVFLNACLLYTSRCV